MENTVVGVFDSSFKAEQACFELKENGFMEENIDVSRKSTERNAEKEGHRTDSITRFFNSLFGNSNEGKSYSGYAEKGTIVTVHTDTRKEAELAALILDKYGDIESSDVPAESFNKYPGREFEGIGPELNTYDEQYKQRDITPGTSLGYPGTSTTDYSTEHPKRKKEKAGDQNWGYSGSAMGDRDVPRSDINKGENLPQEGETVPLSEGSKTIPVVEENLYVSKEDVPGSTIRIKSRIFDKPVEENLRLREEKVSVERKPANRPATAEDLKTFKEGSIEATEREEIPIVGKEAKVVEEVTIKKDISEKVETVRGSVKRQNVVIEKKPKDEEFKDSDFEDKNPETDI